MKDNRGSKNPMFGKCHSEETKRKMSEARKGRVNSRESIEKNRIANTGKKRTPEQRAKISKALAGQKRPWHAGENNPNWRGGKTEESKIIRCSLEYRQWRTAVFERDNYLCIIGGKEHGNKLNADHIKPFATHPELRFAVDNGRTLCEECHRKTETYGRPCK